MEFWNIAAVIRRVKDRVQWAITFFGSFFIVSTLHELTSARDGKPSGAVGKGTSGAVSAAESGRAVGGRAGTAALQTEECFKILPFESPSVVLHFLHWKRFSAVQNSSHMYSPFCMCVSMCRKKY